MALIGRRREKEQFLEWLCSDKSELICISGRRRVGKTFFVNELLEDYYAFDASGLAEGGDSVQLRGFAEALRDYGDAHDELPRDWWDAFRRLKALLDRPECPRTPEGKRAVFLDELPWFDTPRSDFMNAFSDFWNRWAQRRDDVKVVICGSATSWMLREVLQTEGSLNRRVTHSLHISPFTLREVEEYLRVERGIDWDRRDIIECYMVFGGTPYYLRRLQSRLSLAENITALCLTPQAPLKGEAKRLLDTTLSDKPLYYRTLAKLGERKYGFARKELVDALGIKDGNGFSTVLSGLEDCGYIRRYENPYRTGRKAMYQLTDPFLHFSMHFMGEGRPTDWLSYLDTPSYRAWRGNAFEMVCLCHLPQIEHALSLSSMTLREFPWSGSGEMGGTQVDLVIERADRITYLCEMKCTDAPFSVSTTYRKELASKMTVFKEATATRNSVQLVLVSAAGFARGTHADIVARTVEGSELFAF